LYDRYFVDHPIVNCGELIPQVNLEIALFCQIGKIQYLKGLWGFGFDILCSNFIF